MDWKRKLTSRKLWVAVIGLVTGILIYLGKSETEAAQVGALILSLGSVVAYIIGEGWADASGAENSASYIRGFNDGVENEREEKNADEE